MKLMGDNDNLCQKTLIIIGDDNQNRESAIKEAVHKFLKYEMKMYIDNLKNLRYMKISQRDNKYNRDSRNYNVPHNW